MDNDLFSTMKDAMIPMILTFSGLLLIKPEITIAGFFGIILVFIASFMVAVRVLVNYSESNEEGEDNGN